MRFLFSLTLLSVMAFSACKKSDSNHYTMTVNENGTSTWTTTNIITQNANGSVYIVGTNPAGDKVLTLSLNTYRQGTATYNLVNTNYTVSTNSATYDVGATSDFSQSGQVIVTGYESNAMKGTFDIYTTNSHLTGTFATQIP